MVLVKIRRWFWLGHAGGFCWDTPVVLVGTLRWSWLGHAGGFVLANVCKLISVVGLICVWCVRQIVPRVLCW